MLNDPETAQYTHNLTVNGRMEGVYECLISNIYHQNSASIDVKGVYIYMGFIIGSLLFFIPAPSPLDVSVHQNGLTSTSVLVSWRAGEPTVTGYVIRYHQKSSGGQNGSWTTQENETSLIITELVPGATYSIEVIATSDTLPSNVTTTDITLSELNPAQMRNTIFIKFFPQW